MNSEQKSPSCGNLPAVFEPLWETQAGIQGAGSTDEDGVRILAFRAHEMQGLGQRANMV